MMHLKKYTFPREIKKYFIDDMSGTAQPNYFLFRVDKQKRDQLKVTKLYTYHIETQRLEKIMHFTNEKYDLDLSEFKIIFESDSLKEVKDYLVMLSDTKKYNL